MWETVFSRESLKTNETRKWGPPSSPIFLQQFTVGRVSGYLRRAPKLMFSQAFCCSGQRLFFERPHLCSLNVLDGVEVQTWTGRRRFQFNRRSFPLPPVGDSETCLHLRHEIPRDRSGDLWWADRSRKMFWRSKHEKTYRTPTLCHGFSFSFFSFLHPTTTPLRKHPRTHARTRTHSSGQ